MNELTVTKAEIVAGLERLGLRPGDVLFYHSSLSSFGRVDGGADAVVDAMLEALGSEGTLAAPGFTFDLKKRPDPLFDVLNEPSRIGVIAETLRRRPGVRRSHHLTHSVCALGRRAAELTGEHSVTPCGAASPFMKLMLWDAKIAFFGVDQNANTCLHAVEEEVAIPRVGYRTIPGARIRDETGQVCPLPTKVHDSNPRYDFNPADRPLYECGAMTATTVGEAIVRLVSGAALRRWGVEALTRDPEFLSIRSAERNFRPKSARDFERF